MIQFDTKRFANLAKWSLRNDQRYYVKSFFQYLVVFALMFLFFTMATGRWNQRNVDYDYVPCSIAVIIAFAVTVIMGSSFMFYSMDGKHDMQALLMLPASNFEKYLVRYATWIIHLPLILVAFIAADLLQYVVNMLVGREETLLVMQYMADKASRIPHHSDALRWLAVSVVLALGWTHSIYALGATFFRWRKYNWICTSVVLIALGFVLASLWPSGRVSVSEHTAVSILHLSNVVYLLLIAFNFWLSYRLFCRQQLIGKFINW